MKGQQAIGTLVIFIALVITAALASFVLVSTTNALQSKSLAVANKTMEKSTYAFAARSVEGIAQKDGEINYIMIGVELAPGSGTIDLNDTTLIYSARGGTQYKEFSFAGDTTEVNLNTNNISTAPFTGLSDINKYYIVYNRTHAKEAKPNRYVDSGELYVLAFDINNMPLQEGVDWKIIMRAPYIQDLVVTGYAPEVIEANQIITLH